MEDKGGRRQKWAIVAAGLLVGIAASSLYTVGSFEGLESKLFDRALARSERQSIEPSLLLVGMTLKDFPAAPGEEYVGYPDPAAVAGLVEVLSAKGALSIVLNEPVVGPEDSIARLAETAADHGRVVFAVEFIGNGVETLKRGGPPAALANLPVRGEHELLRPATLAFAYNNRLTSPDGVLRRFSPHVGGLPEIGVAAASTALNTLVDLPPGAPATGEEQHIGPQPRAFIPYVRPSSRTYAAVSDVFAGRVTVRGKTVVIGRVDGLVWNTPTGRMTDPEVTLQIASALLQGRRLIRAPIPVVAIAVIMVSLALTMAGSPRNLFLDVALPAGVATVIWIMSKLASSAGAWIDSVPIFAALAGQMIVVPAVRVLTRSPTERREATTLSRRRRFFETLLEMTMHGSFAHSGAVWLAGSNGPEVAVSKGDVPVHLMNAPQETVVTEVVRDEGQVVTIPLNVRGQTRGGVVLIRRRGPRLASPRRQLLDRVAAAFASRIGGEHRGGGSAALDEALYECARIIDEHHRYPPGHADSVAELAISIGRTAPLTEAQIAALRPASHLHDIGMIGVPDAVLDNTEKLTDQEFLRVRQHPLISSRILESAGYSPDIVTAVAGHHERWDGTGYPQGLQGENIPYGGRILALAHAVISMLTSRPYRRGLTLDAVMEEVSMQRGRMFDPLLVEATTELALKEPQAFGSRASESRMP